MYIHCRAAPTHASIQYCISCRSCNDERPRTPTYTGTPGWHSLNPSVARMYSAGKRPTVRLVHARKIYENSCRELIFCIPGYTSRRHWPSCPVLSSLWPRHWTISGCACRGQDRSGSQPVWMVLETCEREGFQLPHGHPTSPPAPRAPRGREANGVLTCHTEGTPPIGALRQAGQQPPRPQESCRAVLCGYGADAVQRSYMM